MKNMCVEFKDGVHKGQTGKVLSEAFFGDDHKFYVVVLSGGEFIKTCTDILVPAGERQSSATAEIEGAIQ